MNIVILNWRDIKNEWAGGGEVYIFEIAKRWVRMGHNVTLLCGQNIRDILPAQETITGIKVVRRGGRYSLYFWAAWAYLTKYGKDADFVVDVQNGIPFLSVLYSRKPKISIVYHVHNKQFFVELPYPINLIGYFIEKFVFPLFYRNIKIIAISKTTKNDLQRLGFKSKNISIVYCGIGSNKKEIMQKKFSKPSILYLGRIKRYKRVDLLVKMMPEIIKKVPKAQLTIAGWGTEASIITDISMRSNIRRRIKIAGPVSAFEKNQLLSKAWVFVNPSMGEGWGISIIEANQNGTPSVVFDVPGLSESVKHGETGFLAKDYDDMINKIVQILEDKTLRNRLSKNSVKHSSTFSWDKAAEQAFKVLNTAMNPKTRSFYKKVPKILESKN